MKAAIEVTLCAGPLERIDGDVAVAGFFTDERPLRGGAARADWRLCGGLSRRIESGDLSGKSGEALLIGCGLALKAPRLMLLGLGDRHAFDLLRVTDETREALDRCAKLRCGRVVMAPLGIAPDDVPRHAAAIVQGIRDAWQAVTLALDLQLCVPRAELAGVARALETARKAVDLTNMIVSMPSETE